MTELDALLVESERKENESLADYAVRLSRLWADSKNLENRKTKAQFFTPKEVSTFMANMFTIEKTSFRLLDPGAGVGNLTAAFCARLLTNYPLKYSICVDAYENDSDLIPSLRSVLDECKAELNHRGHCMKYNIYEEDFVIHNEKILELETLAPFQTDRIYDYIISNPPYYKLERSSSQAIVMRKFISGHPNIYALFMILSTKMLNENGELVFITPRSFCSGMYYKRFRNWFLGNVCINHIHIFESRRDIFGADQVLQENILIKATKSTSAQESIKISSSKSKLFDSFHEILARRDDVVFRKNGDVFIRIPSSWRDVATLRSIDTWPKTLKDLGLEISTGPVVVFRTKEEDVGNQIGKITQWVPLIWMHNFSNMRIRWPAMKKNKPNSIYVNARTKPLLLPVKNYVLLGRFSFKEQRKRLNVAVLLEEDFPCELIGLENHVNYIHKLDGELSKEEAWGIAALLNTRLIDNYFRSLNGNTQVNAVDIRSLPLPNINQIEEIGKRFLEVQANNVDSDKIVYEVLKINYGEIVNYPGDVN